MTIDYNHFQKKLEAEKMLVEAEMQKIGRQNPDSPSDWEAVPEEHDTSLADENTVADAIESYEDNTAIMNTLEARRRDILSGLDKLKNGTYGLCQVCGKEIEDDRLEANPSARTCKAHME